MAKRKAGDMAGIDWEQEPCPLCTKETLPQEPEIRWVACESKECARWFHCACVDVQPQAIAAFYCRDCEAAGVGKTRPREERPKRATKDGVDYGALDAGEHINSLRHSYTSLIESRTFAKATVRTLEGARLTKAYLDETGFTEPIVVHDPAGLDLDIPPDLTIDRVVELVGRDTPVEVMDVPTQGEDKGWTLGNWAEYYNDPTPSRVRNVISLEVSDSALGAMVKKPKLVRELDLLDNFWPKASYSAGEMPKVQTYCLMSSQNSYTDFHIDFAGTSVYYHIVQGAKTFLFIPPTPSNLKKYSDWCMSSNQSKTFLAEQCKETFKVELVKGDTMFIPPGWIHAVHTPSKSLVIGGNFLHLHGLEKHLDVALLEEKTKVPGKFRFPQFERTLWFTVIGLLAQRPRLCSHEVSGVVRLSRHLQARLDSSGDGGRRTGAESIPRDHIAGDVAQLLRHLNEYLGLLDKTLDDLPGVTEEDRSGRVFLIKADLTLDRYKELVPAGQDPDMASKTTTTLQNETYVQAWLQLPLAATDSPVAYLGHVDSRGLYGSDDAPKQASPQIPAPDVVEGGTEDTKAPETSESVNGIRQDSPVLPTNGFYDNTYLPPLMAFNPMPDSPPQPKKSSSSTPASDKNATTCFRCKTRKRKCNKERPCSSCIEVGLADTCVASATFVVPFNTPSVAPVFTTPESLKRKLAEEGFGSPAPMPASSKVETPVSSVKKVKVAGVKQQGESPSSRKPRKPGNRCGRCARDKKQCGREFPICDRCQKKGLQLADCVYPDRPEAHGNGTESIDPSLSQSLSPRHITEFASEGTLKSHVPQLTIPSEGGEGASPPLDDRAGAPTLGLAHSTNDLSDILPALLDPALNDDSSGEPKT